MQFIKPRLGCRRRDERPFGGIPTKARRIWLPEPKGKDGTLTKSWQATTRRAFSHLLALCAVALVLFVTLVPTHAESVDPANVSPLEIPPSVQKVRQQSALGPTSAPSASDQRKLSPALLANYVERQKALRSFDVSAVQQPGELNSQVLMGYIARGSFGGSNGALSAIDSLAPAGPKQPSGLNSEILAKYIDEGFLPTGKRIEQANTERECLAQAIYHEARGESEAGQMAVANVIVNRARSGKFPSTLCGVIYQNADKGRYRCQFTFACDGRADTPGERRAWARSAALAETVYAEYAKGEKLGSLPRSALFYHTTAVSPSWSHTFSQVAQIGSHIFYSPN
ncbi:cell wall hydrolase [Devosia sp. 1566]|uniref:cell wall hydrolase n=1 Tax=Devosia sp. 1566 TaxID=2499144 RepID=UPI000FDC547E|nr:cell wall hydrolase [Devosia sp. 1566]